MLAVVMVVVAPGRRASAPPNILLVTLDTTRADRKGAYGYHEARTPRLDRLAAAGVLFARAIAIAVAPPGMRAAKKLKAAGQ